MHDSSETQPDGAAGEAKAYEQECLRETREQLARVTAPDAEPCTLRAVRLEGDYPDTRLVIDLWDSRYAKQITRNYPIWQEGSFTGYRGGRAEPKTVGMLVTTWALGG
jgi:hypothetical protein